jgi:2-C-methyl-D-erythritol 4-phosphate cytidylyltransferase
MFRHGMLLRALREAAHVTDEASAVEALGYKPKLIEGSTKNLKVTFADDLEIAEQILKEAAS